MSKKSMLVEIQEQINALTAKIAEVEATQDESPRVKLGDIVVGGRETETKRLVCETDDGDLILYTIEGKHIGEQTSGLSCEKDDDGTCALEELLYYYDSSAWEVVA